MIARNFMQSTIHSFKNDIKSANAELQVFLLNDRDVVKSKCETIIARIILTISSLISIIVH